MPEIHGYLLNGELVSNMKEEGKDFNGFILFDVLHRENKLLIGSSILERYHIIRSMFAWQPYNDYLYIHPECPNLYFVRNLRCDLRQTMEKLYQLPEDGNRCYIEGFIFKNPAQKLTFPTSEYANSGGMIKSRVPTKNYHF
jgi:hypothetical protein